MKRIYSTLTKAVFFGATLASWSLCFVNDAAAPPVGPSPDSSAAGTIAQIAAITAVSAYGMFKVLRRK
jgi:hypothetical protein